jgi:hypothetical protein
MTRLRTFIVILLAALVIPTSAQSMDTDALAYVSTAFDNMKALESFTITSQSVTQIEGIPGGGDSPLMESSSTFDIVGENSSGTMTMTSSFAFGQQDAQESTTEAEVVMVDGETYIQFLDAPDFPEGQEIEIPEGWFNPEQMNEQAATLTGGIEELPAGILDLPINEESIIELTELEADTINDQGMRVFQLTLDAEYIAENEITGLFGGGMAMGAGGQGQMPFGGMTPPADAPALPTPDGTAEMMSPEDAEITFAVWIGDDDQLVHRVYTVLTLAPGEGATVPISLRMTTVTNFSNFNEPFEILAPEVAS